MGQIPQLELTGEPSNSVKKYSLQYLRPYHREIAGRLVLGETQAEISRSMDINQGRLSIVCNSPVMKNEVKRLEDMRDSGVHDVTVQLEELAPTMLEVVERLAIYGTKESLRLEAAEDLLDRCPSTSKVTKIDQSTVVETHEERMARLLGIRPDQVYAKTPNPDQVVDVTPSAHSVSDSNDVDMEGDSKAKEGLELATK